VFPVTAWSLQDPLFVALVTPCIHYTALSGLESYLNSGGQMRTETADKCRPRVITPLWRHGRQARVPGGGLVAPGPDLRGPRHALHPLHHGGTGHHHDGASPGESSVMLFVTAKGTGHGAKERILLDQPWPPPLQHRGDSKGPAVTNAVLTDPKSPLIMQDFAAGEAVRN
jgi:hypothetical protein